MPILQYWHATEKNSMNAVMLARLFPAGHFGKDANSRTPHLLQFNKTVKQNSTKLLNCKPLVLFSSVLFYKDTRIQKAPRISASIEFATFLSFEIKATHVETYYKAQKIKHFPVFIPDSKNLLNQPNKHRSTQDYSLEWLPDLNTQEILTFLRFDMIPSINLVEKNVFQIKLKTLQEGKTNYCYRIKAYYCLLPVEFLQVCNVLIAKAWTRCLNPYKNTHFTKHRCMKAAIFEWRKKSSSPSMLQFSVDFLWTFCFREITY